MTGARTGEVTSTSTAARSARLYLLVGGIAWVLSLLLTEPYKGWSFVGFLCATAVAGVVAVGRDPSRSNPAWFLTAGAFLLIPAYVLWYPATLHWDYAFGSPAVTDALFISGYVCFLIALARRIGRRDTTERRIDILDTLIIGVGLGVLVWVLFISPYLFDDSLSWLARLVAVSYPVLNLLLLGAVIRMQVQGGIATTGDRLLTGWIVVQLTADLVYAVTTLRGTFTVFEPFVDLFPASFVLLGAALLHPTTAEPPPSVPAERSITGVRRFILVVPAALIPPVVIAILGIRAGDRQIPMVALLSAVLFGLVLARVWMLVVDIEEHRRIRRQLTESVELERRRTEENQVLLTSLRERQMLSDRLSRIQRKISTRAPLQEVLDTITHGAAELVHEDVAALRFIDEANPSEMVMVSSTGVDPDVAEEVRRLPLGVGVGGRAIAENQLCIQDAYNQWDGAIGQFVSSGLQTAMAAPVHLGSEPIGSLVVATNRQDRAYSKAEQEALISFAEHVSIALNDARSVRAMNDALDQAVHQAMHDELTGLPNRACFYDRAEQALKAARRAGTSTAVLLFDLDRFKEINDTLGHRYGDRVLCAIGPRIQPLLRDSDSVARLGGDEFCVLLSQVHGIEDALHVARRITTALEDPIEVDAMTLVVESSCGVAVAPEHGDTADLLLQRADIAMYVAKTARTRVVPYDAELDRNTPDRLALLPELRAALTGDELTVHYQPQLDLETDAVLGVEALVRWCHPRRGLLGPEVFIPIAEDTGLIHPLTTWVLEASLDQLRRWMDDPAVDLHPGFTVAVNLSTHSLLDESFVTEVAVALARFGVPADRLVLEITETTLMADPARATRVLTTLAELGVHFAIDDFGTGYSSLASLKDLPVHELKIDRSFVHGMHIDSDDAKIVRSVVELGHTLGLRTVAEGVEHEDARDQLVAIGCDRAQGHLFSRALPAFELETWFRSRSRASAVAG